MTQMQEEITPISSPDLPETAGKKFDAELPSGKNQKQKVAKPKKSAEPSCGEKVQVTDSSMLGITVKKHDQFADWFTQVITKGEMIDYYDVSGCYVLRPNSFFVWETVQRYLDDCFKTKDVQNCYFPMFVTKSKLETEKDHLEGFAAEVAWVTKSGNSELAEPIAIRPTSETIMYPSYAKWVRSHRDLPILLNQWNAVVRWEFKHPTPFIRSREFLWQEGHTAHVSEAEAIGFARDILEFYRSCYEDYMSIPVVPGRKSAAEKFAGSSTSFTLETYIAANGRGLQSCTSHYLGQNFSKMFNIQFEDDNKNKQFAYQTSWGFSTRSIGALVMIHSDDKGLVTPPKVAPTQVVIVPIVSKEDASELIAACDNLKKTLSAAKIRTTVDARPGYKPGWKYNHWELKGVCIRMEVGPRDLKNNSVRLVRRDNGEKVDVSQEGLAATVQQMLDTIQKDMFLKAKKDLEENIVQVTEWKDVMPNLNNKKLILAPWCDTVESEEAIKKETSAQTPNVVETTTAESAEAQSSAPALSGAMKTLCIPFEQPPLPEGTKCFYTGAPAKVWALWGRSY